MTDLYKFRAETESSIQEFSALQKEAQKTRGFELAGFYGDCKKENLKHLKRINGWIKEEA